MPGEVPLTEGRDLGPTLWNAWMQPLYVQVTDERYGLDMETHLGGVTVGLDRRFGENVVLGASIAMQNSSTKGFDNLLQAKTTGFTIGPYLAIRLSPHWAIDTSLTYGQYDNDLELSCIGWKLRYSAVVRQHHGARAVYVRRNFVRPKASVTYARVESDEI